MAKALGAVGLAFFALSAIAASAASAAGFQTNETGTLSGVALTPQAFKTNAGEIRCTTASASGSVTAMASETLKVLVNYSGCTAFGFTSVTVSPAEYVLHANGAEDVLNMVTFTVPLAGCSLTVGPQSGIGTIAYSNSGMNLVATSAISGIVYTSTGGLCGSSGTNGTFTGSDELALNGGAGLLAFAPGGTLTMKIIQGGKEPQQCEFNKVGETCTVTFEWKGAGEAKVAAAELRGAEAAVRYKNAKAGCTVGKVLKNAESCSDEIELIKVAAKTSNEWVVKWPVGGKNFAWAAELKQP
jgi:hypothetical protein